MKAESVSKIKYLKIWDILRQETDEKHPMSTSDLIARLEACGISCDRRTLYRNIEELNENGYEILVKKGKSNGYYVEDRSFDIPEIQILMDAVQAASFITDKKTPVLIDKIAQLAGSQRAEVLKSNIVQFGTVKGSNESIYYSVNEISQAIIEKRKIGFYYFDYDIHHKRKYRMRTSKPDEQRWYVVNPVATVFHDDKYYLFCYNDYHGNIPVYFEQENIHTIKNRNNIILVISESVRWGFQRRYEKGMMILNPNTPYGYKLEYGELVPDPVQAPIIKRIFEEYAATGHSSLICQKLNREGIRTATGKTFKPSTILYYIKNEKYKGDCLMEKRVLLNGRAVKNTGQITQYYVENHHEPIVSRELWEKANEVRKKQTKADVFQPKGDNPLDGVPIRCGKCGHAYIRRFTNGQQYRFVCGGHDDVRFRKCENPSVRLQTLQNITIRIFNDLRGTKRRLIEMPLSSELVALNGELERLLAQERTYLQLQAKGLLEGHVEGEYNRLLNQIVRTEDRRKELLRTNAMNVEAENDLRKYNKVIMQPKLTEFNAEIFQALVKKITIYGRENFVFELTNGQVAKVKTYYFHNKEDEIDEVVYEKVWGKQ